MWYELKCFVIQAVGLKNGKILLMRSLTHAQQIVIESGIQATQVRTFAFYFLFILNNSNMSSCIGTRMARCYP
jgi:hypothetical protein